jgi:hypothetical protein
MIRIVTWNMQGSGFGGSKWSTDVSRLFSQAEADLVCLQDCGSVPPRAVTTPSSSLSPSFPCTVFTWNLGSQKKPVQVSILWLKTRTGGNLAIVGPSTYVAPPPLFVQKGDSLLALGILFKIQQGTTLSVYTSNSFFGGGLDDPLLLEQIANTPNQPTWFAAGDFQQEPSDWVWNQDIIPKGVIYCGHAPVAMLPGVGTNLDYAFIGPGQSPQGPQVQAVQGRVDSTFISSDHLPIFYELPYDLVTS